MSYLEHHLVGNEKIIYQTGMSSAVLIGPMVLATIGAIIDIIMISVMIAANMSMPGGFITIAIVTFICGALVLSRYIKYRNTEYVVTDKRIVMSKGWINKSTFDISLKKCEGVTYKRTLLGKVCNYADVAISGTGERLIVFSSVSNPEEFKNQIHAAIFD